VIPLVLGTGVVHRDVEPTEPCDSLVDQSADVIVLADVGVDELGLRVERAQLVDERLARLVAPTGNDHLRALPGKGNGGGAADAGQGACDQNDGMTHDRFLERGGRI
jgi:hypothetical protein